jgi:glycosyltransferase involved in cell wall biosynthesis
VVTVAPEPEEPGRRARNGLASMYKCFDDDRLSRSLPAALLCLPEFYRAEGRDPDAARRGIDEFRFLLPGLTETRRWLQGRRARPDATLLPLFGDPLGPLDKAPDQAAVAASLGLTAALGSRRRILVLTNDVLTNRMAGPAIRAWHLSDVLADEHEVCLATLTGLCTLTSPRFEARAVEPDEVMTLADWAEVIVVQGFVTEWVPALRSTSKVVVVDLYDPLHFETLELAKSDAKGDRDKRVNHAVKTLQHQLQRGDYFMCASAKQRDLWVGQLAALGRVNPQTYDEDPSLDRLIGVVPFGIPDEDPVHTRPALRGVVPGIDDDAEVLLWAGGIYNWFDPLTLIRAVHALAPRRPSLRLFFMGLRHPNPEVPQMKVATAARALADDLQLTGRVVFFNEGWVSYDDRQNYLMEADVGVSTHFLHAETAYSFRTRILDYLWAGLPIVATEGDSFADLIAAEGLGAVVPAADAGALADALDRLLGDRQDMDRCRSNADRVRNAFRWSSVVAPVGQFCRAPRRAPDLMAMEPLTGIRASPHPVMASVAQQVSKALARWAAGGGAHGELAPPPAGSR